MAIKIQQLSSFRNSLLAGTAALLVAAVLPHEAAATTGAWLNAPSSSDWNTNANWNPGPAPEVSGDTAVFGSTTQTTVTLSATTTVSVLNFGASAPAYTISDVGHAFTVDGATANPGFSNTPGFIQTLSFSGAATATFGSATVNVSPVTLANVALNATGTAALTFATGGNAGNATIGLAAGTSLAFTGTGTGGSAAVTSTGAAINLSGATGGVSLGNLSDTSGGAETLNLGGNALTIGSNNVASTYDGVISGTGGLIVIGGGTLVLGNAGNTYSGGTTLNNASLSLANGAALGTGALATAAGTSNNLVFTASTGLGQGVDLAASSALTVNTGANTVTMASNIIGTDSTALIKTGIGNLILAGNGGSVGNTTISGGTLTLGPSFGTNLGIVTNNATLDLNNSSQQILSLAGNGIVNLGSGTLNIANTTSNTTYSGTIIGTGSLYKAGTNIQTLTGANTYSGGTTIQGGILQGNTSSIQGNVTDNASLIFAQPSTGIYNGVISGTGTLTKTGNGDVFLNGANTATGMTSILNGILTVGDAAHTGATIGGTVTITNFGVLRGHGTIDGNVINNAAVIPGASIGTLTVNGNYSQAGNAILGIEVSPAASDLLAVRGTAALNSGTLALLPDNGVYMPYTHYTVLTAAGGVTGTFGAVDNLAPTIVGFSVSYLPNSVTVTTLPAYNFAAQQAALGASANNVRTAAALDAAYPTAAGDFRNVLNSIYVTTPQQQQQTFAQLSGEMRSNFATVNVANVTALHDTLLNRLDSRQGLTTAAAKGDGMPNMFQVAAQDTDDMGPLWGPASSNRTLPMMAFPPGSAASAISATPAATRDRRPSSTRPVA